MKELQETCARRLVQALDQEIRRRGRGSIRAVDRAAGYQEGWWQHRVASGDISARQLFAVLEHLGLDPVGFVRKALGAEGLGLDRPCGDPPEIVTRAWKRLAKGDAGNGIGEPCLKTLDQRRYEDPEEVVRFVRWAVDHVELELLPKLLGIAGSALRLLILLDDAEHAIHAGIEIAEQRVEVGTVGNLLQRLSYVVADQGDRSEALRLAERATLTFVRIGDQVGTAKATVEQGIWLYYLGRFEESRQAHRSALELLPEGCARYRCTAHQYLGLNHRELGRPQEALRQAGEAERLARVAGIEEWAERKLVWLRARIYSDLGMLEEAASLLLTVVDSFRDLHPGEAVLASCDLVRVHLLRKHPDEAYLVVRSMLALVEPLRRNKIVSAALGDLLRCGREGLTLALVQDAQACIEDERKRHRKMWLSMKKSSR